MIKKENILKNFIKVEDKLLVSKILDKAEQAEYKRNNTYSDFLDPYQRSLVERALSGISNIDYAFSGGYNGAERTIVIFGPDFVCKNDDMLYELPFRLIRIETLGRENLTHRDYLGAIMSLGIKREKIGDILVREESCDIVVSGDIADYIVYNLNKIGNSKIRVKSEKVDGLEPPDDNRKEINVTVASLRLDCIASAGFNMSRSKAIDYIKAEKVNLNWDTANNPTKQVKIGDTISIRGKGRVVLEDIGGTTKKDRIKVLLKKYI